MIEYKLGDLIKIFNGKNYVHLKKGTVPVYGTGGIMCYVSDSLYDGKAVLLPRKGSLSNIMYTENKIWTVDTMYYATVNENIANPYYLYRYLTLLDLSCLDSGSTLPSMTKSAYNNLIINLPDIFIQNKIANVLSSLDKKIELNNKINKELEAMAKTLYDYWFVQFDFPDENGKPYKSSGGKMVYNEELKREIPAGWDINVKSIADLIKTNKGGDWGKANIEGNYTQKVSCARGADINGLNGLGELNPPERFILKKNSNKILEPNDLIVEISGGSPTQSTGRLAFVIEETLKRFDNPIICSNFCKSFSLKDSNLLYFFCIYLEYAI